jgi:hypothetical protein
MNEKIKFIDKAEVPTSQKHQDFEALLALHQSQNQKNKQLPMQKWLYAAMGAAAMLIIGVGIALWQPENKPQFALSDPAQEVAYLVSSHDMAQAERLVFTNENAKQYPYKHLKTTVLEENAEPELGLQNFLQMVRQQGDCRARIDFIVAADGTIQSIQIQESQAQVCKEKVLELLAKYPKWKPAQLEGEKLPQRFIVLI